MVMAGKGARSEAGGIVLAELDAAEERIAQLESELAGRSELAVSPYRQPAARPSEQARALRANDHVEVVAPGADQQWRRGMIFTVYAVTREGVLVDGGADFLWFHEIEPVGFDVALPKPARIPSFACETVRPGKSVAA